MGLLNLLGFGTNSKNLQEFKSKGAIIIDVRTPGEFAGGHIAGSKNIPLNSITNQTDTIKEQKKPVIVCCASGMRSAQAASILKRHGIEAMNGGGWRSLENKIKTS